MIIFLAFNQADRIHLEYLKHYEEDMGFTKNGLEIARN